jgi:hypothetical protein
MGRGDVIDVTPLAAESRAEPRSEDPRGKKKKGEKFRYAIFHPLRCCQTIYCAARDDGLASG